MLTLFLLFLLTEAWELSRPLLPPSPLPHPSSAGTGVNLGLGRGYFDAMHPRMRIRLNWDRNIFPLENWDCLVVNVGSTDLEKLAEDWGHVTVQMGMGASTPQGGLVGSNNRENVKFIETIELTDRLGVPGYADMFVDYEKNMLILPHGINVQQPIATGNGIRRFLSYRRDLNAPFHADGLCMYVSSTRLSGLLEQMADHTGTVDRNVWHVVRIDTDPERFLHLMATEEAYLLYYLYTKGGLDFSRPGTVPGECWFNAEKKRIGIKFIDPPPPRPHEDVWPPRGRTRGPN